jgi:hypothetical protein
MSRLRVRIGFSRLELLAVIFLIVVLCLTVWLALIAPLHTHSRWYWRIRGDIMELVHKRPPELSKGQWEFVVGWTINLHANCGGIYSSVDPAWPDGFANELERRLAGPITLADIEWIWDEYVTYAKYGQTYSEKWRPTQAEGFLQVQEGCFGIRVD